MRGRIMLGELKSGDGLKTLNIKRLKMNKFKRITTFIQVIACSDGLVLENTMGISEKSVDHRS
jgi:hypothetical protein